MSKTRLATGFEHNLQQIIYFCIDNIKIEVDIMFQVKKI